MAVPSKNEPALLSAIRTLHAGETIDTPTNAPTLLAAIKVLTAAEQSPPPAPTQKASPRRWTVSAVWTPKV